MWLREIGQIKELKEMYPENKFDFLDPNTYYIKDVETNPADGNRDEFKYVGIFPVIDILSREDKPGFIFNKDGNFYVEVKSQTELAQTNEEIGLTQLKLQKAIEEENYEAAQSLKMPISELQEKLEAQINIQLTDTDKEAIRKVFI